MAQIRGELQREKFVKNISFEDQQVKNNRIAIPIGDEESDDIMKLNGNYDDRDENENEEETDEFIKSWFERLEEEENINDNTLDDDISDSEIDEDSLEFNELLRRQIHPADNDDAKWDLLTLFKSELIVPSFFSDMLS